MSADPWHALLEGRTEPAAAWTLFDRAPAPLRVHWLGRLTHPDRHGPIVAALALGMDRWDRPSQVALATARLRVAQAEPESVRTLVAEAKHRSAERIVALGPAPRPLGAALWFELVVVGPFAAKVAWFMLSFQAVLGFAKPEARWEPSAIAWFVIPAVLLAISAWDNQKHMDRLRRGMVSLVERIDAEGRRGPDGNPDTRRMYYTYRYINPDGVRYKTTMKKMWFGDDGYKGSGPWVTLVLPGTARLFTDSRHAGAAVTADGRLTVAWTGWFWIAWVVVTLSLFFVTLALHGLPT